ncbi:hypothetical protein D3C87_2064130 [compost metagenome]
MELRGFFEYAGREYDEEVGAHFTPVYLPETRDSSWHNGALYVENERVAQFQPVSFGKALFE